MSSVAAALNCYNSHKNKQTKSNTTNFNITSGLYLDSYETQ